MFKRSPDPAFDMNAPVRKDDSVRDYQLYAYHAIDSKSRTIIELQVLDTSKYFLPCEAFIEVEGEIIRTNDTKYSAGTQVGFVNNGIMALFDSAKYLIDGKEIESINRDVDVATTIIGLARYSDDYTRSAGPSMMFAKDGKDKAGKNPFLFRQPKNRAADPANNDEVEDMIINHEPNFNLGAATRMSMLEGANRSFSYAIPLHHSFGFCRNVRNVIYGAKHTVALVRKGTDDDAIWRISADPTHLDVDAGKVNLTKLSLWMPVLTPSITAEEQLLSFMDQGGKSLISWLTTTTDVKQSDVNGLFSWNLASQQGVSAPRHIFIAEQDNARVGSQLRSHMIFDQLGISDVSLRINGQQEPSEDIQLNYDLNHIACVYHRLLSFMARDKNVDTGLQISQYDFRNLYPIYYFSFEHLDLTRQSVFDIHFRANINRAIMGPDMIANYRAVAVILSDKSMLLEGVGGRMRVIDAPVENM